MIIVILILSIAFNLYCLFLTLFRITKIKGLTEDLLPTKAKQEYLKTLKYYIKVFLICLGFPIFTTMMTFIGIIRFIFPIISIIISSKILYKIFDEMEEFDFNKKDIEILKEFLQQRRKETENKKSKIKVIQSEEDLIDEEEIKNITDKKNDVS